MAISKKELSDLIEKLSDKDVPLVADLVKRLIHPLDYYIPYDDEPLTEDDLHAIQEAKKEHLEGKPIKFEDILDELQMSYPSDHSNTSKNSIKIVKSEFPATYCYSLKTLVIPNLT